MRNKEQVIGMVAVLIFLAISVGYYVQKSQKEYSATITPEVREDESINTDNPGTNLEQLADSDTESVLPEDSAEPAANENGDAQSASPEERETAFADKYDLRTNTAKRTIPLPGILSGGPGKDGIPAINNPKFVSVAESRVNDKVRGIVVEINEKRRFYPYNILAWHEIVNDEIDGTAFAVTFCPLCDSGIVFNRRVGKDTLRFGVSGLLFESNLLMYDTKTESLWSQARGEAVVGDYTGTELEILPLQLITFEEAKEKYPQIRVLSTDTGFGRDYNRTPYAGYLVTNQLFFPVSVSDKRFSAKELFYVTPFENKSVALPYRQFEEGKREFTVEGKKLVIERDGGEIFVTHNGAEVPGYFELWFSWATHHQDDGVVLQL